jgi:16S rRNA (guanine527-N7)-methyltransferase
LDRRREPLPTRVQDTAGLPASYDHALRRGLDALGIELAPGAADAIEGHVRLLLAWTPSINLTAIRDAEAVATGHVVDSLTALPWIAGHRPQRLLDLGSGGGFPGLPLAAALRPTLASLEVTLLEPTAKKARFLSTAVEATGLDDRVTVDAQRAEDIARDPAARARWDVITARAVASAADLVELAFPLLAPGGSLVAWKRGDLTVESAAALRAIDALGGGRLEVVDVGVHGLETHRLMVATRGARGAVPDRYPRDPGLRRRQPW